MRRIVTGILTYFRDLAGATASSWNRFFFSPADPTTVGLIRLIVGVLAFWSLLVYGIDLGDYFGSTGWADPATIERVHRAQAPLAWSFWMWLPDSLIRPVWLICLVVLGLYTVGLWSRVTAVLAWVILVSTARRAPISLFGFDQVLATLALYLAVTGASGEAVSLDRFWSRWRRLRDGFARAKLSQRRPELLTERGQPAPSINANLCLRLIQLHLCLIYGMAGLAKLQGPTWWNGMAIWGLFAAGEFRVIDFTWLAVFPWFLNLLTHTALALEIAYPVLIWNRWLRPLVLVMVMVLHVGIGLSAPGLIVFAVAMIAANLAFVSGEWLRSLVVGTDASTPVGRVLYDGACPRCRASVALITAADPDRRIACLDLTAVDVTKIHPSLTHEACMRAMHVVGRNGRVVAGYDAVAAIARWLPIFWPCGLVGIVPGVPAIGRRIYQKIADSRPRDVPCTDEVCGIHGPSHS